MVVGTNPQKVVGTLLSTHQIVEGGYVPSGPTYSTTLAKEQGKISVFLIC